MTYNNTFDPDCQISAEERIASIIFEYQWSGQSSDYFRDCDDVLTEEDCKLLSQRILHDVLSKFRPDLIKD